MSAVCEARRPSLASLRVELSPAVPGGTTKAAWPREPSAGSTEAVTTCTPAIPPLVAYAFCPLSTHSSVASSYTARVRMAATSEPASGSVLQNAATAGSSVVPKHCGTHSINWSGVPVP